MHKKIIDKLIFFSFLLIISAVVYTNAQTTNSLFRHEKFVIRSMKTIHGAQMTYASTYGNGNYGTLSQLSQTGLIDSNLVADGDHGYRYTMSVTFATTTMPASFQLMALPIHYPKTGRRSLYMDTSREFHGADKNGLPATASDPYIDSCALFGGISENEGCSIADLRMLHGAEMTYSSTYGNGNYGSLSQLGETGLIYRSLATGLNHGYSFTVTFIVATQTVPATFRINATPQIYGTTGVRSFFMDTGGVLHGADKHGEPATENDPVIETCTNGSIVENERCTIGSLRTLHGAEMTYASTYGNGSYTSLAELARVGLMEERLGSGELRGYLFVVSTFPQTPNIPATFKVTATPQVYETTGIRSFFIGTEGVIRGADKHGEPADENDPPITD